MNNIITLTVNPIVDKSTTIDGLRPNIELKCTTPVFRAGGGGINVSIAIKNLGGKSLSIYLAGGPNGVRLQNLMEDEGMSQEVIMLRGRTRDYLSVTDTATELEYRFGIPGPFVTEKEWQDSLNKVEENLQAGDFMVASGKLPLGIPDDFFMKVAAIAKKKKARLILDTKGVGLIHAVKADIFLFKPNLTELSTVCGVGSISYSELETLAVDFLERHSCEVLVVSLGASGALLVSQQEVEYIQAPVVHQKSIIGAGDSMVAGMALSLLADKSFIEMAQFGVACGTAATMRSGTQLCQKEDADKLYEWIRLHSKNIKKK